MAINQQAFIPEAPAFARSNPAAYYAWLTSNGFPHRVAYDQTTAIFGAPKTPEEQQKEAAAAAQRGQFAQAGGVVGGALLAGEAIRRFPNIREQLNIGQTPTEATGSGSLSITRSVPPPTTTVDGSGAVVDLGGGGTATPQIIKTEGAVSTVNTPVGPQQVPTESLNDPGFWQSVNWSQVAQGGLGIAQLYGAYRAYKSGDKVGAGLMGATGAANLAGAAGAELGGAVIPGLNIVTGAYTGYKTAEALGDMAAGSQRTTTGVVGGATAGASIGAGVGSIVPGVGTAIGAGIGAVVGAVAGGAGAYFGSSKKKPQMQRDAIRSVLQEGGILDDKFQGTLADGSTYDFGKDGSTLKWKNIDKIAEAQPTAWNAAVPAADALAASYGFVGQKASDIAAWYAKGAVSNAADDPNVARANMQHFAKQQGITMDLIKSKLDSALADNRINQSKYDYYMRGANELLGGAAISGQSGQTTTPIARPNKGEVGRQSAGLYRNDQGKLVKARSMREALGKAYDKSKQKEKK